MGLVIGNVYLFYLTPNVEVAGNKYEVRLRGLWWIE
jgi:hypothetical protein